MAAILRQESHELRHVLEINGIVNELFLLPRGYQSGAYEFFQMERHRRSGNFQRFTDAPCGHAFRPGLDQQTKNRKPSFLGKRREGRHRTLNFHISSIIEIIETSRREMSLAI